MCVILQQGRKIEADKVCNEGDRVVCKAGGDFQE